MNLFHLRIKMIMIWGNNHCEFSFYVIFWLWWCFEIGKIKKKNWNFKILKYLCILCLYVTEYFKKVFKWRCVCTFLKKLCNFPHLESHVSNWHFFCLEMWPHWPGHPYDIIFRSDHYMKANYSLQFGLGKLTPEEAVSGLTGRIIIAFI